MQDNAELSEPGLVAEAPAGALGFRPSNRVLLLGDDEAASRTAYDALVAGGYKAAIAAPGSDYKLINLDNHDVVLIAAAPNLDATATALRELRQAPGGDDVSLLVQFDDNAAAISSEAWAALRGAGADDLLPPQAISVEMTARIEALARTAQLARELKTSREDLSRHLRLDEVTQLLNRRFFFQGAHRECARARRYDHPLSCMMLDIDFLALYNQNFSYACGDYILRTVAHIIRQWTRESDILGRFGGAKFVVLLAETDIQGAMMSREKLQHVVATTEFIWKDTKLPVTVSIGESERRAERRRAPGDKARPLEEYPLEEDEIEMLSVREELADLLADADAALFVAKKGARYPSVCVDAPPGLVNIPTYNN